MAKSTKTKLKTLKKKKPKVEEVHRVAPLIPEGLISLFMSKEDMRTLANLMSVCAKTFEDLALEAAKENDDNKFSVLQARHRLCSLFAEKAIDACRMPEPISRDFH